MLVVLLERRECHFEFILSYRLDEVLVVRCFVE